MEYPKPLMRKTELMKMGFSQRYLDRAYSSNGNNFATKVNPSKRTSAIIYDTAGFEAWRQKEIKAQRGRP